MQTTQIILGTPVTLKYRTHSDGYVVTTVDESGVTLRKLPAASRKRGQAPRFVEGFAIWSHLYTETEVSWFLSDPGQSPELVLPIDGDGAVQLAADDGATVEFGHARYFRDMSR